MRKMFVQTMCKKVNTQSKTKQATGRAMNIVSPAQKKERERTKESSSLSVMVRALADLCGKRAPRVYRKFEQARAQAQNHLTLLVSMFI